MSNSRSAARSSRQMGSTQSLLSTAVRKRDRGRKRRHGSRSAAAAGYPSAVVEEPAMLLSPELAEALSTPAESLQNAKKVYQGRYSADKKTGKKRGLSSNASRKRRASSDDQEEEERGQGGGEGDGSDNQREEEEEEEESNSLVMLAQGKSSVNGSGGKKKKLKKGKKGTGALSAQHLMKFEVETRGMPKAVRDKVRQDYIANAGLAPDQVPMSKKKLKRLAKMEQARLKKAQRAEAYKHLNAHRLDESHRKLLAGTGEMGKRETQRHKITMQFRQEKAGIAHILHGDDQSEGNSGNNDVRLHQVREVVEMEAAQAAASAAASESAAAAELRNEMRRQKRRERKRRRKELELQRKKAERLQQQKSAASSKGAEEQEEEEDDSDDQAAAMSDQASEESPDDAEPKGDEEEEEESGDDDWGVDDGDFLSFHKKSDAAPVNKFASLISSKKAQQEDDVENHDSDDANEEEDQESFQDDGHSNLQYTDSSDSGSNSDADAAAVSKLQPQSASGGGGLFSVGFGVVDISKKRRKRTTRTIRQLPSAPATASAAASAEKDQDQSSDDNSEENEDDENENEQEDDEDSDQEQAEDANDDSFSMPVFAREDKFQVSNNPFVAQPKPVSEQERAYAAAASGAQMLRQSTLVVHVDRDPAIQAARLELPICSHEQEIMEAISQNDVMILCGETGSGKTTQLPQFLYEAGYGSPESKEFSGMVGVTEPRRVAAVSTSRRVATELNLPKHSKVCSYQIRFDSKIDDTTRIKFMTDGVLLREIQGDFLLRKYSAIVLDEAHERNLNTDILIGLLSRIVPLRRKMYTEGAKFEGQPVCPLKLIIMSATLRVDDFCKNERLFPSPPPVLNVPSRQFSVTVHYTKKTPLDNWLEMATKTVCKIHSRLPPGGILVFLTGRSDIEYMCKQLNSIFNGRRRAGNAQNAAASEPSAMQQEDDEEQMPAGTVAEEALQSALVRAKEALGPNATEEELQAEADKLLHDISDAEDDYEEDDEDLDEADAENEVGEDGAAPSVNEEKSGDANSKDAAPKDQEDEDWAKVKAKFEAATLAAGRGLVGTAGGLALRDGGAGKEGGGGDDELRDSWDRKFKVLAANNKTGRVRVLPLYSLLDTKKQMSIFEPTPDGERLIVVSTNVAETSLTIPGIKYVVECGREKRKTFDRVTGTSRFVVDWISKSSADQRSGRAGRTAPGHAYRMYSQACYGAQFEQHSPPEILSAPFSSTALQMKAMHVEDVANFPFPTPPPREALTQSLKQLTMLGALKSGSGEITPLGRTLASFPVAPRFAKMLVLGNQGDCLAHVVAMVASLCVSELWLPAPLNPEGAAQKKKNKDDAAAAAAAASGEEDEGDDSLDEDDLKDERLREQTKIFESYQEAIGRWAHPTSDLLSLLRVVGAFDFASFSARKKKQKKKKKKSKSSELRRQRRDRARRYAARVQFCRDNWLRVKAMLEVDALRKQLSRICLRMLGAEQQAAAQGSQLSEEVAGVLRGDSPLQPPSVEQELLLGQVLLGGFIDQVGFRMTPEMHAVIIKQEPDYAGYLAGSYQTLSTKEPVFLHPTSSLARRANQSPPTWICYHELTQSTKAHHVIGIPRTYARGVSIIEPSWLANVGGSLCSFGAPLKAPSPKFDSDEDRIVAFCTASFGPHNWKLPIQRVPFPPGSHEVYRHFGRLLLLGDVVDCVKSARPFFVQKPSAMMQQPGLSPVAVSLLRALQSHGVHTLAALKQQLAKDPSYLSAELRAWMQPAYVDQLVWPPPEFVQGGGGGGGRIQKKKKKKMKKNKRQRVH